jgi:hypothetical protein
MTTHKPYGKLPADMRPHLPKLVAMLRRAGIPRPYDFVAELFGISASRAQQVVLTERNKAKGATSEVTDPADQVGGGHPAS